MAKTNYSISNIETTLLKCREYLSGLSLFKDKRDLLFTLIYLHVINDLFTGKQQHLRQQCLNNGITDEAGILAVLESPDRYKKTTIFVPPAARWEELIRQESSKLISACNNALQALSKDGNNLDGYLRLDLLSDLKLDSATFRKVMDEVSNISCHSLGIEEEDESYTPQEIARAIMSFIVPLITDVESLLPERISPKNDAYKTVVSLRRALEEAFRHRRIKNIALTGPYGSGKSSILRTLEDEKRDDWEILPISLATLRVDDSTEREELSETEQEQREEALNRRIEYSILQQLIYREKIETVPNSRFRRIAHIPSSQLCRYIGGVILFILAFFIAFEPSWGRVDTLYQIFSWGKISIVFDLLAIAYMLWAGGAVIRYCLLNYANSKLNKLSPQELEVELAEDTSIFNRHLDEILYFFQATRYNVVLIEDLDRFGTSNIFLKLRELNFLLNVSKAVDRHIVFIYAVKDDIFKDEERTKFFDYILTVIPIINPSNSKDKLKEALIQRGFIEGEISDDDLSEMAFFILDMRILKNIANEYSQYRQQLCGGQQKLDYTRLLAMIVYKNYYPEDFAQLHRRGGKIYECLSKEKKLFFQRHALEGLKQKEEELELLRAELAKTEHLQKTDLRKLFIFALVEGIGEVPPKIYLRGEWHHLSTIEDDDTLFEELRGLSKIEYLKSYGYSQTYDFDFDLIDRKVAYSTRLEALSRSRMILLEDEAKIKEEKRKITNLSLEKLLSKHAIGETDEFKSIGLSPMMDVFLRRGYINEDYYDYISYFYEGMISDSDRDLLLSIKRQLPQDYALHIDKVENFYKELRGYMYEHDAILNNDLLDYVALHQREGFEQIMRRVLRNDSPLDFLAQYYARGRQQEKVFEYYISREQRGSWARIMQHSEEQEKELLLEAWFLYSEAAISKLEDAKSWLNMHYDFLVKHKANIGSDRCKALCLSCTFTEISIEDEDLLNHVILQNGYSRNLHNLCTVVSYLLQEKVSENILNYTWIRRTKNERAIEYIDRYLDEVLSLFLGGAKEEETESILMLLNSEGLDDEQKKDYLRNQQNRLPSYDNIKEEFYDMATELLLIAPSWENVAFYYHLSDSLRPELIKYLEVYANSLGRLSLAIDREQARSLFEEIALEQTIPSTKVYSLLNPFKSKDFYLENFVIRDLDVARLRYLIQQHFIVLSEVNTEELRETPVFGDYLIENIGSLMLNPTSSYFERKEVSTQLLLSQKLLDTAKFELLKFIPPAHLYASRKVANIVCHLLNKANSISLDNEVLYEVISHATILEDRLGLALKMLQNVSDPSMVAEILSALGGVYRQISEQTASPLLDKTEQNEELLSLLRTQGFISTFKLDSQGKYRVYPPMTS